MPEPTEPIEFAPLNDVRCELGEGPVYDQRRRALWYCDIVGKALHRFDLASGATRQWKFDSEVASLGIAQSGRLVVALRDMVSLFDPDDGGYTELASIERHLPATRLNDGKVGPDGAFWVGTMDDTGRPRTPIGALYRIDARGHVELKIAELSVSNGLAFSADGRTMFHADTNAPWIDRWDFDPATGNISNRTRIVERGRPDGGAADIEGCYWSADVGGARLNRYRRDGTLLAVYPVPVATPTMPCFGGDDFTTLFVTSLRADRPQEVLDRYPLTGITITGKSPVPGVPVGLFRDA